MSGARPASYSVGYRGHLPPEVKRLGRDADLSPPSNFDVKNAWIYTTTHPVHLHCVLRKLCNRYVWLSWCLVKYSHKFVLPLYDGVI